MAERQEFSHRSVLLDECMDGLNISPDGIYVDGTVGGGGHSFEIAKRLSGGRLIAIDRDEAAIRAASARLAVYGDTATIVRSNFYELASVCEQLNIESIDGLLLDLGVSSHQLDIPDRGFSYMADAPLDMRMDKRDGLTAFDVVNGYSEERLKKILYEYGEERFSAAIVAAIVRERQKKPIETTLELSDIIKYSIPPHAREGGHHPAKRSFQAIRIEVNGELDAIAPAIRKASEVMAKGGRIVIITFHSLEDRIVKQTYADMASGCTCPKNLPICVCGKTPEVKVLTKKPILPSEREIEENPRSRSAKLRVCEKL